MNGKAWHLVTFLLGILVALVGAYASFPRDLVTKEYLDLKMQSYEEQTKQVARWEVDDRKSIDSINVDIGAMKERLRMEDAIK